MRYLFFFFIAILPCISGNGQAGETNYREELRMIDVWLNAQRDFDNLPGISVAIVKDQNIIFSKGYGFADVEKKSLCRRKVFAAFARYLNCLLLWRLCSCGSREN